MKSRTTKSGKRRRHSRFDALRAKPPLYWLKFVVFFSLVGFVGYQSAIHAVANIVWQQNPDLALRLVPDHPLALSLKADVQFMESQQPASLNTVETMAKHSLKGQLLNPVAVRLLGYVADSRGDRQKARALLRLAHKISRRDFGTQLWLIEDAVARGDKRQALYHYDIAMRTTPPSHQILFPTLIGALDDPEVRVGLSTYVRQAPDWLPGFLNEAINTSENPANVADLLVKAGPLPPEYTGLSNNLLLRLSDRSEFYAFRQYYLSLPGSTVATLRSSALNKSTVNLRYPAAGWQLFGNPALGGAFSSADKAGRHRFSVFAGSGERGELLRKYTSLRPGAYRFSASYKGEAGSADASIRWEMACMSAEENRVTWFSTTPVSEGQFRTIQAFSISADCPNQMLRFLVAGGSSQIGAEFLLSSVNITPR